MSIMDIILEAFYNSDKFSHKRYILENQGRTKDEIKRIIEHQLMNLECLNDNINTILKSQIERLLKEKYDGHIDFPILNVFKEQYSKNIVDISSNINKVRMICLEEGILLQEIVAATFKNIEDDIIKRADCFIQNEIRGNCESNRKLYLSYFNENNIKFLEISTQNKSLTNDVINILSRLHSLDELWKSKTQSDILLIKRISQDTSLENIKKHFKSIYETKIGEINEIKKTLLLLTCSVDKIMNERERERDNERDPKSDERICNLEKQNKSLISRIESLEKKDSDKELLYKNKFKNMNDTLRSLSDKHINSKELISLHETKLTQVNQKLTQVNQKLTQSIKDNNARFKKLSETKEQIRELEINITNINVTLKSISKHNVEKDIILKNEIYKHIDCKISHYKIIDSKVIDSKVIDSKVIDSKVIDSEVISSEVISNKDDKSVIDEINRLKEEVIKIRGEIDVIFRHNVNQTPQHEQLQYQIQYPVNHQLPQYPPMQYLVNQPHY
jgi:hypothetical protein